MNSCKNCGNEFRVKPNERDIRKFCSMKCRVEYANEATCIVCGKIFKRSPAHIARIKKPTCSRKCRDDARRMERTKYICFVCGEEFYRLPCQRKGEYPTCSKKCNGLSTKTQGKKSKALSGRPQPAGQLEAQRATKMAKGSWKPIGTIVNRPRKGGTYAEIKVAEGLGNKNWMLHHRWIAGQHIGRDLVPGEEVHHIDGNTLNNSMDNLAVISKIDHSLINKLLRTIDGSLAKTIVQTLMSRFPEIISSG